MIKQWYFKHFSLALVRFFFVYTQLDVKIFLFQTIYLSRGTQLRCQTDLFDPYIGTRVRVDLGVIVMKAYSAFQKTAALMKPYHQIV